MSKSKILFLSLGCLALTEFGGGGNAATRSKAGGALAKKIGKGNAKREIALSNPKKSGGKKTAAPAKKGGGKKGGKIFLKLS
jgi:hypothetical protein